MSRHFMTDNILAGWQFDRFMFTMRLCRWARPHAMECHKDLIKEITLIVSKTTHEHNLNHNIVITTLKSPNTINSITTSYE